MNISIFQNKFILISIVLWGLQLSLKAQNQDFSILFYNVENLFDTIDDIHKNDNEFLPDSKKQWNTFKYYTKLENISKAIMYAGQWSPPDIIGLAEIETQACALDLIHKTPLSKQHYKLIYSESSDIRGIDIACAYNPKTFKVISKEDITIDLSLYNSFTRNILHVNGIILNSNDTIDLYFCHFPSRYGGAKKSEIKRIIAAQTLSKNVDSIRNNRPLSQIIILGDFNDTQENKSIKILTDSTNLQAVEDSSYYGTHSYQNKWQTLDQCFISQNTLSNFVIKYSIIHNQFLLRSNSNGKEKPYRSYNGPAYIGGYSDHLPIIITLSSSVKH